MKPKLLLLAGAFLAGSLVLPLAAQNQPIDPSRPPGSDNDINRTPANGSSAPGAGNVINHSADTERDTARLTDIEIRNFQDETLGRVRDLGIDLVHGQIVEVLVASGTFLGMGGKTTAVPPFALFSDQTANCYRLNASKELFDSAPAVDLSTWHDATHGKRIAAAYRLFGQEPYFLIEGEAAGLTKAGHPKVTLGYVERSSKMLDLPVENFQHVKLGNVFSLTLDIPKGRIRSVVVISAFDGGSKSLIPAMSMNFNDARDGLMLNDTKVAFQAEPRYIYTEGMFGNSGTVDIQTYKAPRTDLALEQGSSYRDVDRTVLINKNIRAANLKVQNLEVATLDDRVTVRGWVATEADRHRVGEIAVAASRPENVDNQVQVGRPAAANNPVSVN